MHRLLILLAFPMAVPACECSIAPLCERMRTSPIVFLGETVSGGLDPDEDAWSGGPTSAKLRVLEAFRGVSANQKYVDISLAFWAGMCSPMSYRLGERTLVFLHKDKSGRLTDSLCTASIFADEGSRELELVRRYFAGGSTAVVGTVRQNNEPYMARMQPLAGARVSVAGEASASHSVLTSPDGSFEIRGLPPGRYRLSATKSGYEGREYSSTSVELDRSGCAIADLSLWTSNSVSGRVVGRDRTPVKGARVLLRRRDAPPIRGWGLLERTDETGRFRFTEVAPGSYEAVVSPFGPRAESPYDTAYHGAARRREDAEPFEVGPQSEIDGIEITLGDQYPTRRVLVVASWPDGSEAAVKVSCREAGDAAPPIPWFRSLYFDSPNPNGCEVLQDRPFKISIEEARLGMHLEPLTRSRQMWIEAGVDDVEWEVDLSEADFERPRR